MMDFSEKRYSIDPGKGKKMDGCPYSVYEDGSDVKEYIIPPKGYVFKGFQFDPDARNQIYDGKLIAEYAKEPLKQRFKNNLWMLILSIVIIAVVTLIIILAAGVFKKSESSPRPPKASQTVVQPKDTIAQKDTKTTVKEKPITETPVVTQPTKEVPTATNSDKNDDTNQVTPPAANDPNTQFKQEFWSLIHQCTYPMDSYHDLYTNYKGKVECEEYNYLQYTILKDYVSYKAWHEKLKMIPTNELQSIKSIDELKQRIRG